MNKDKLYTQQELDVELLKNNQGHIFKVLDKIESQQRWILGLMGTGFLGLLGLMARGFKWVI